MYAVSNQNFQKTSILNAMSQGPSFPSAAVEFRAGGCQGFKNFEVNRKGACPALKQEIVERGKPKQLNKSDILNSLIMALNLAKDTFKLDNQTTFF